MESAAAATASTVVRLQPDQTAGSADATRAHARQRSTAAFGAELVGIDAGVHRVPAAVHHRVGVHVGTPVRANCRCNGRRLARLQSHGDADVIPAGLDGEWIDESDCTILRIWFSEAFVARTAAQLDLTASRAQLQPRFQMRDKRFEHLAWALRAELEANEASDALYAESLYTAMVVRLLDAKVNPTSEKRRRLLTPKASARVVDYIESHLDRPLTLAELAALVELSVPHFKVLFRETLGVPVHQYVVRRRVERACELLRDGRYSTAQVALETGFAHQSHLAHWMRRLMGVTPSHARTSDRTAPSDAA